jgi:hypothetical protein
MKFALPRTETEAPTPQELPMVAAASISALPAADKFPSISIELETDTF